MPDTVKIFDIVFTVPPSPYSEGHVCTAAEAAALSQVRKESLRNNFYPRVRRQAERGKLSPEGIAKLQSDFNSYAQEYEFGRRISRPQVDPIKREAQRLARTAVLTKLREEGRDESEEVIEQYIEDVLLRYPSFTEKAKQRVEALQGIAIGALDLRT